MKRVKKLPGKQIGVSLSAEEWDQVRSDVERSTCRSVSEYARKRLLDRPVEFRWRNVSFDRFVDEIVVLRRSMEDLIARPELIPPETDRLASLYAEVKTVINKIVDICSPT